MFTVSAAPAARGRMGMPFRSVVRKTGHTSVPLSGYSGIPCPQTRSTPTIVMRRFVQPCLHPRILVVALAVEGDAVADPAARVATDVAAAPEARHTDLLQATLRAAARRDEIEVADSLLATVATGASAFCVDTYACMNQHC